MAEKAQGMLQNLHHIRGIKDNLEAHVSQELETYKETFHQAKQSELEELEKLRDAVRQEKAQLETARKDVERDQARLASERKLLADEKARTVPAQVIEKVVTVNAAASPGSSLDDIAKLRSLVAKWQKSSFKWQNECKNLVHKFNTQVSNLLNVSLADAVF